MIEYGLQGKVALVSGINNVEGIGAACAFALAAQGAKLVLVYKPVPHPYDAGNTHRPGMDRYFRANAGDAAQAFAGQICYGASKAAIEAFTRSIALEAAPRGVTVNCVAPGPTQTGYIDAALEADLLPGMPLGRLVRPEDIADAILFLVSDQAGMITGQVLKVAGGHAL